MNTMILKTLFTTRACLLFSGCLRLIPFDYQTIWQRQGKDLKQLVEKIKREGTYEFGNHDFPENFSYPFDNGFHISYGFDNTQRAIKLDNKNYNITFYTDRGLLDHYSAFVYTTDSSLINYFDEKVAYDEEDQDEKLEENWYYISD